MTAIALRQPRISLRADVAQWVRQMPMALIVVAQAVLSVRLMMEARYPSGDEARYIYAGHQLIYEFWHGGGSPFYETYFSGAPVIYPVLAAMADHLGGLAAVRLMSLVFMSCATILANATGRHLFGYWPGVAAAGLFAGIGLTQDLGVYATYDGMSLMLTAAAVYCAIRTSPQDPYARRWLLLLPLALLAANATKYMTVAFDPVTITIAALRAAPLGWRHAAKRLVALGVTTMSLLGLVTYLAGWAYIHGIMFTTLARHSALQQFLGGSPLQPARVILTHSWHWIGPAVVLAVLALAGAALLRDKGQAALLAVLVGAGILVTVEALKLHSGQSMKKHDDFSAWFACIAAGAIPGYVQHTIKNGIGRLAAALVSVAVMLPGLYLTPRALATYPGGTGIMAVPAATLRPYLGGGHRLLLGGISDENIVYIDRINLHWFNYFDDIYLKYPIPGRGGDSHGQHLGPSCFRIRPHCMYLEGPAAYQAAIRAHWFALVSMIGDHLTANGKYIHQDLVIEQTVEHTPGYVLLTTVGGAPTWICAADYASRRR